MAKVKKTRSATQEEIDRIGGAGISFGLARLPRPPVESDSKNPRSNHQARNRQRAEIGPAVEPNPEDATQDLDDSENDPELSPAMEALCRAEKRDTVVAKVAYLTAASFAIWSFTQHPWYTRAILLLAAIAILWGVLAQITKRKSELRELRRREEIEREKREGLMLDLGFPTVRMIEWEEMASRWQVQWARGEPQRILPGDEAVSWGHSPGWSGLGLRRKGKIVALITVMHSVGRVDG